MLHLAQLVVHCLTGSQGPLKHDTAGGHLHEDDGGLGDGAEGAADEEPCDVLAVRVQVLEQELPVLLRRTVLPPAHRRLIVMRAWPHQNNDRL